VQTLRIDDVVELLRAMPEQPVFDWKRDFTLPNADDARGEFLKDLAAIANSIRDSYGFVFYGVDPKREDPVLGISSQYDDASLQQLVSGKIEPAPKFLYYELSVGPRVVGVLQVSPEMARPHIIRVDLGKLRRGQILLRRGSSTDAATIDDLLDYFYGPHSSYFPRVTAAMQAQAAQLQAHSAHLRELRAGADAALRDMEIAVGLPPGSLGSR
jgi:hypothetical protein